MTKIAKQKRSWSSKMVVRWRHCSLSIYIGLGHGGLKFTRVFFNLDEFTKKFTKNRPKTN